MKNYLKCYLGQTLSFDFDCFNINNFYFVDQWDTNQTRYNDYEFERIDY